MSQNNTNKPFLKLILNKILIMTAIVNFLSTTANAMTRDNLKEKIGFFYSRYYHHTSPLINDKETTVAVTGASGYIASWVVLDLLSRGYKVNATVRQLNSDKVNHLKLLGELHPGKITLFEADLLIKNSFDNAILDVDYVIHVASPYFSDSNNNKSNLVQLIETASRGTINVLTSVNKAANVKRVILTSSISAVVGDYSKVSSGNVNELMWNTTDSISNGPYAYSKTLAERAAWAIHDSQNRWDMVSINPVGVFGPCLSERTDFTSYNLIKSFIDGKYKHGVFDLTIGLVDVRDVAKAHVDAISSTIQPNRYILIEGAYTLKNIADIIENFGQFQLPTRVFPKWVAYIIAPYIGLDRNYIKHNVGYTINIKPNNKILNRYLPIQCTFEDHIKQILMKSK